MRYGLDSKCVGKFRPYSVQRMSNETLKHNSRDPKFRRISVQVPVRILIDVRQLKIFRSTSNVEHFV